MAQTASTWPVDTPLQYLFYDTLTGSFIETLPLRGVTFGGGPINTAGSASGNLDIQDPGVAKSNWLNATKPIYATLIIDYNGKIVWGGPVTGRKETFGQNGFELEIDAIEGWGWWNQVVQATDYSSPPYSGITGPTIVTATDGVTDGITNNLDSASGLFTSSLVGQSILIGPITRTIVGYNSPTEIVYNGAPITAVSGIQWQAGGMPWWNASSVLTSVPGYGDQPFVWDPMLIAAQILMDATGQYPATDAIPFQNVWGGVGLKLNGYYVDPTNNPNDYGNQYLNSAGAVPSSNYVELNFPYPSLQTVAALLQQLTSLGYGIGFDGAIDYEYENGERYGNLVATCNLSYPYRGTAQDVSGLYVNLGNVEGWSFPEDGTNQATTVYETGGNQDIVVIQNIFPVGAYRGPGDGQGYPNTAKVINIANLNSPNPTTLLQQMGINDLNLYSFPPVAPLITIDLFDNECGLGQFKTGDEAAILIPPVGMDGRVFDPRFPGGIDQNNIWRIVSYQATVADQGHSTMDIQFDTPPVAIRQNPTI